LRDPTFDSSEIKELRERAAKRLAGFPASVRAEQVRARVKYYSILFVYGGLLYGIASFIVYVMRGLLNLIGLTVPGFATFASFAPFAFCFWGSFWPFTRRWDGVFRQFFGVRPKLFRRIDLSPIESAIRSGMALGLHLRAFADEDIFAPTSRGEVPEAVKPLDSVFFISVSNPGQRVAASATFPVVEIPSHAWKEAVFELMQIASVIVLDTNAGVLHWVGDIEASSILSFRAMSAEFHRRLGFVDELKEIIANDFAYKTVAVVPPGWSEWKTSGEIAAQIIVEEYAAERAKEFHPLLRPEGPFPRTELKRMLLQLPLTAVTTEEIRATVQRVLSKAPADSN
jgi:hypothetical protein